ncbi:MAG: hypothetical protein ABR520_11160 [Mycobacteriales bacterium]|nr:hypothetical protein [Actinomycetota bacterium]
MTREFPEGDIDELLEDSTEIDSQPWRHGRKVRLVFEADGAHWAAWFDSHHDEGIQTYGPVKAVKVHQVERTVKVWEKVPDPAPEGSAP